MDGNERLAWLATVVFLDLTGLEVMLTDDEAFDLVSATCGTAPTDTEPRRSLLHALASTIRVAARTAA